MNTTKRVQSLNHVGIAVRSIEAQSHYYSQVLGAEYEGAEEVPSQHVRVAFYRVGDVRLELLEPLGDSGPIAKFIATRGEGLHHVAFGVTDLKQRISELQQAGITMIDQQPRTGSHHMQIAFLHPKSTHGVLTELCEPAADA
ncbi:Glyoxalase/Bleomycin resistance protein/Dioxygenase superfamily protein [Pirellulimonas nuda]|uniref:Glyoxalase/Bleomycin resistance protein/Dioxygenase superfamily protein n=1 Tax=Pirellulimonas nuda TaxID=2528009 RepID=A0A518DFW5_9BACT|nr:methylmalonyl-CoA epimerase [Pirellulimonas nuda]QDU90366.1 Glyoxalase/Bleomycin resistance protein/Dioxygenase superfamily protein [Pirellulimonas nuda]